MMKEFSFFYLFLDFYLEFLYRQSFNGFLDTKCRTKIFMRYFMKKCKECFQEKKKLLIVGRRSKVWWKIPQKRRNIYKKYSFEIFSNFYLHLWHANHFFVRCFENNIFSPALKLSYFFNNEKQINFRSIIVYLSVNTFIHVMNEVCFLLAWNIDVNIDDWFRKVKELTNNHKSLSRYRGHSSRIFHFCPLSNYVKFRLRWHFLMVK